MILEVLHEEVEHTNARAKTALHQVESLREGIELYGVQLPDKAEIEASIRQPTPEPQSPGTPTRTPPAQLFQDLLVDMLNRTPSSSPSNIPTEPFSLLEAAQSPIMPEKAPRSPPLEALAELVQLVPVPSSNSPSSTFLTPAGTVAGDSITDASVGEGKELDAGLYTDD